MPADRSIPVWRRMSAWSRPAVDDSAEVVIVGGGPVGLAMALDLGLRGHRVIVVNRLDFIAAGSKAICFSKRTLEIFDRLGVGDFMLAKGVVWNTGKVFWSDRPDPVYQFDLLPIKQQKHPAFVNIQQYYVEEGLVRSLERLANVELRWGHEAIGISAGDSGVSLQISGPLGKYLLRASYVIACDGSRSSVRDLLHLDFQGRTFEDNFLIADIRMKGERPVERWFWFDPPFNPGQSALLHKQPDDVWRLDFQLGWDIDREACMQPANVERLVRAMLGPDIPFEKEWYSLYTFRCCRMSRFVHGRVIFAGDSAHLVSPFGARGCNGGFADVANLGWKLDLVLKGRADGRLLDTYDYEAIVTADENILHSSRATDFMTPKSQASRALRDAVLQLAAEHEFARPFVNSGRLSTAVAYPDSPLNSADTDRWSGGVPPGTVAIDAPIGGDWLLERLGGGFKLVADACQAPAPQDVELIDIAQLQTDTSLLRSRYELRPGAAYLIRPDQYVAARWKRASSEKISAALARASGRS